MIDELYDCQIMALTADLHPALSSRCRIVTSLERYFIVHFTGFSVSFVKCTSMKTRFVRN